MPVWLLPILNYLGKGWERFLSILVWLILIGLVLFACWATFIKPTFHPIPTSTQTGGTSINYHPTFGCMRVVPLEVQNVSNKASNATTVSRK